MGSARYSRLRHTTEASLPGFAKLNGLKHQVVSYPKQQSCWEEWPGESDLVQRISAVFVSIPCMAGPHSGGDFTSSSGPIGFAGCHALPPMDSTSCCVEHYSWQLL